MEASPGGRVRMCSRYLACLLSWLLSLVYSGRIPALGHSCLGITMPRGPTGWCKSGPLLLHALAFQAMVY